MSFNIEKQHVLVAFLMVALVFGGGVKYGKYLEQQKPPIIVSPAPTGETAEKSGKKEPTEVVVHVTGAVIRPGVYTLRAGDRVIDAVNLAGPLADANLDAINLAKKLADQERILVPSISAPAIPVSGGETKNAQPFASGGEGNSQQIDINSASMDDLQRLPGIGPAKARSIVEYREQNGPFASIEDITKVSGIGKATFEKIKAQITCY